MAEEPTFASIKHEFTVTTRNLHPQLAEELSSNDMMSLVSDIAASFTLNYLRRQKYETMRRTRALEAGTLGFKKSDTSVIPDQANKPAENKG